MSNTNKKIPRTIIGHSHAIAMALEMEGIDSAELFEKADIPYQSISDPAYRIEAYKFTKLFKLAVEATNNPSFGLLATLHMQPGNFHALGFSLVSSSNLHDFCQRLVRFFRLLSDNIQHHLIEEKERYKLHVEIINPDLSTESLDAWMGCIVHLCRNISRPYFAPLRVELTRPKPSSHAEDFERFFKSPVIFSAAENVIYFSKSDMLADLPTGSSELARRNDEVVIEHLARLDREDIVRRVEAKIVELLPTGECSKEKIASLLNISLRSLHYKLEQKNTCYQETLENLRSGLAIQYIEQKNISISEITYLLGFSDVSNFSRAFRRWSGMPPSEYRKRKAKPKASDTK